MARGRWPIRIVCLLVVLAAAGVLLDAAGGALVRHLGGNWRHAPEDAPWLLSDEAQALVARAYDGLDGPVRDYRAYLLSTGGNGGDGYDNRSYVHPRFLHGWRPRSRLYGAAIADAAGVRDMARADVEYLARLVRLARNLPHEHRIRLAALDQRYDADGRPLPDATPYYVDNDYVADIAERHSDLFRPVVSVHPFRRDALDALERWAGRGVDAVHWWPAVQGFDPSDERLDPYYRALVENDLMLIVRTGGGAGLADADRGHGNPWHLRRALAQGVRVVLSGAGGPARYPDPEAGTDGDGGTPRISGVTMFLRLLRASGDNGRLYADLGGIVHRERVPGGLAEVLQHPDAFDRLVYASGYPLPAINAAVDPAALAGHGFVTGEQAKALAEIQDVNPLLFDFVAKRLARLPHTDLGLPPSAFTRDIVTEP